MLSVHSIRTIIGIIGNVISFGLFASPIPTFWRIFNKKSVEEFKPDPYLATVLNCLFWIYYGLPVVHPDSTLIWTINGVGLVMELIYLSIFFYYSDWTWKNRNRILVVLLAEVVILGSIATGTLVGLHTTKDRSTWVGAFCVAFGILMYASPCTAMYKVYKDKSVEYMPFWITFVGFINGLIWTTYGSLEYDINLLIANGAGASLGFIQLTVWIFYRFMYPKCCTGSDAADLEMGAPKALGNNV